MVSQRTGVCTRGAVLHDREIRHAKRVELLRREGELYRRSRGEESPFIGVRVLPNAVDLAVVSSKRVARVYPGRSALRFNNIELQTRDIIESANYYRYR